MSFVENAIAHISHSLNAVNFSGVLNEPQLAELTNTPNYIPCFLNHMTEVTVQMTNKMLWLNMMGEPTSLSISLHFASVR